MTSSKEQFTLNLGHRPALGFEDFLVAPCNAEAVAWLDSWPAWPSHGMVLHGPAGCGKTHLLAAFAAQHDAVLIKALELNTALVPALGESKRLVLVDDLDGLTDETALFHLHNLIRETGHFLVLAARHPPAHLPLRLPDLASRLRALPAAGIGAPDDQVLAAIIVKLFADRQLKVGEDVVAFLTGRIERSFAAAGAAVAALDQASLAGQRAVTVPLSRSVLGI